MSKIFFEQDTPEQRRQIIELERRGFQVRRMTQYHVKIGKVNYYITKGTITIDPTIRYEKKGFDALLGLLDHMSRNVGTEIG
ncbi:hypothetical protein [Bradyrhizobium sp. CB1015]|uniref:hypothetical protein n=1 Tax=Bradyrhizobium sp. CB1015 TaxID=2976822 RepID=UPI0021AAD8C2|nr:hypothetical protein [Bradyrhizobium sp. CB1015]UWU92939.1 hypothetical protein N2604_02975 [Bradyrhizobium sp. CB1015]